MIDDDEQKSSDTSTREESGSICMQTSTVDTSINASSAADDEGDEEDDLAKDYDWFDCSLCDDLDEDDEDAPMPLPGRESHTADMDTFRGMVAHIREIERDPEETPFNEVFWKYMESMLLFATPVGFTELPDRNAVFPIGPKENGAIISKYGKTSPINPIHPLVVAEQSGVPLDIVLTELLYANEVGLVRMRWTPFCDRCGGPNCAKDFRSRVPDLAYCRGCRYRTAIDCLEKIKVIFLFSQDVFYVLATTLACKPSQEALRVTEVIAMFPATFSGSGFRVSIGCDGDRALRPPMSAGRYRMRCPVSLTDSFLVVERDTTDMDEPHEVYFHVSDFVYRGGPVPDVVVPHGRLRMKVFCDSKSFFILWVTQNADNKTLMYVPPEERAPLTDSATVMQHTTYKILYEGTSVEAELFTKAVADMTEEGADDEEDNYQNHQGDSGGLDERVSDDE